MPINRCSLENPAFNNAQSFGAQLRALSINSAQLCLATPRHTRRKSQRSFSNQKRSGKPHRFFRWKYQGIWEKIRLRRYLHIIFQDLESCLVLNIPAAAFFQASTSYLTLTEKHAGKKNTQFVREARLLVRFQSIF